MMCVKPFMQGSVGFGCGQCFACRLNRRRLWTHRIVLESLCHDANAFVTLTYNDENLRWPGTLDPADLRNFFKRLRKIAPRPLRFYSVGEYGDRTWRPHYHAAIFGLGVLESGLVEHAWSLGGRSLGHTYTGDLTAQSAAYVAGYVTKKMTSKDDPRLEVDGVKLHPEFARMSNRPGIGANAMSVLADTIHTDNGLHSLVDGDVPMELRHNGKMWPLGRYLREKLREEIGMTDEQREQIKARFFSEKSQEMRALLEGKPLTGAETFATKLSEPHLQKIASLEAREKIYANHKRQL